MLFENQTKNIIQQLLSETDAQKAIQFLLERCIDEYHDEDWLAERWDVSVKLIQKLRYQGNGPTFMKVGTLVRYSLSDIVEYEANHKQNNNCSLAKELQPISSTD